MTALRSQPLPNADDARATAPSPAELAELMSAFNAVTAKLEDTHHTLRAEVARLNDELSDTRSQLRRAQELAALGEMAAGIAHEVRNPLGSIRLYAEALAQDLDDRPQESNIARNIVSSVTHLNGVVGDVLAFARELRVNTETLDAADVIDAAITACHRDDLKATVDVHNLTSQPDTTIDADPTLLRQAVINVVRNAVEAAASNATNPEPTPRVTVEAKPIALREQSGARREATAIIVTDNGPGIPEDVRTRIFNPFFTTRETGTGLGLAIVHRILDAHNGRVSIEDNPEVTQQRGTRVTLAIPHTHQHADAQRNGERDTHEGAHG